VRFDYRYLRAGHPSAHGDLASEGAGESLLQLEAEYAIRRNVSIGFELPFMLSSAASDQRGFSGGHAEIGLKVATPFEAQRLVLSYGLELGIPLGAHEDELDAVDVESFVGLGHMWGNLEVIGFTKLGVPTKRGEEGTIEAELGYNLSLLYHLTPDLEGILEFDGGLAGPETATHITPGFKFAPMADAPLRVGLGVSLPLSYIEESGTHAHMSVFYHF
jgi:hypothetical protein